MNATVLLITSYISAFGGINHKVVDGFETPEACVEALDAYVAEPVDVQVFCIDTVTNMVYRRGDYAE